jgi:hypothetical protein
MVTLFSFEGCPEGILGHLVNHYQVTSRAIRHAPLAGVDSMKSFKNDFVDIKNKNL